MTAGELLKELQQQPADAEVGMLWDGAARTVVRFVWLGRGGHVVLADYNEPCYYLEDRPVGAAGDGDHWRTPGRPE